MNPSRQPTPARRRLIEVLLDVAAVAVALWAGFLLATLGALLAPLRLGGVPVPISIVIAIAGNVAVIYFGYLVTARVALALLPGAVWLVVTFASARSTDEGDLIFAGGGVSSATYLTSVGYMLAGSITIGVVAYRLILRHAGGRPDPSGMGTVKRDPSR